MCKACKMDPSDMARYRTRQGALDVEDFEKEVNYRPSAKAKKTKGKTRPGCPGNEYGPHVYVWTSEREMDSLFYRYFGWHKYQSHICAGCGKKDRSKYSDKYEARKKKEWDKRYAVSVKRGEPVGRGRGRGPYYRYWEWESYHEGFRAYRKDYLTQKGFTNLVYGW